MLLPYQQFWVNDPAPLKIYLKARQIGFSFAETLAEVLECLERPGTVWLLLSRGERQALELARKAKQHCQSIGAVATLHENDSVAAGFSRAGAAGLKAAATRTRVGGMPAATAGLPGVSIAQHRLEFPNGSTIIALPANPDTARGYTANVLLDEFAFHRDARAIYAAVYPSITRGFKLRIGSTPFGESGTFYELWVGQNAFAKHRTDIYEAAAQGLKLDLEQLRAGCPDEEIWRQEYACEFVSDATSWIPWELIVAAEQADESCGPLPTAATVARESATETQSTQRKEQVQKDKDFSVPLCLSGDLFLGADIARHRDLTVLYVVERLGDVLYTRAIERLANATFAEQQARIERWLFPGLPHTGVVIPNPAERDEGSAFRNSATKAHGQADSSSPPQRGLGMTGYEASSLVARRNAVRRCAIDATGLGAMLAETLEKKFGARVEPVHFTLAVKEDLALRVKRLFEERRIRIPEQRELRAAIHAVRKYTTAGGHFRFDAERTDRGHADEFWALALAAYAAEAGPVAALAGVDPQTARRPFLFDRVGEGSALPIAVNARGELREPGGLPYQAEAMREPECSARQGFFGPRGFAVAAGLPAAGKL